eukprot:TRINITY_DN11585_c0_g1_i2.p1 TRINITY_DN11585_c0_g1~~TRINITY_DN11585_c0_g1_i2.p1  ORF type:complete len:672 (+),score=230.35 TRINITY_DN11585_c0_g1_i2:241-2016(+)
MREYFRAFHLQDTKIRADYEKYFKPNLCYLEGTWTEASENLSEPFQSDRHHVAADSWQDLTAQLRFYANNGQKSLNENLPYLPSAFRDMLETEQGAQAGGLPFEPRLAQWFYRIKCIPLKQKVSTKRLRVRNDLHVQLGGESTPMTRAQLGNSWRAMYELDPTPSKEYAPDNLYPKGPTALEFIDELMAEVPGFDGPHGNLQDHSLGVTAMHANGSGVLNTAFYSRYSALQSNDAMGRDLQKRGYNDYLFAAQTTHPKVSPADACLSEEEAFDYKDDKERVELCGEHTTRELCSAQPQWPAAQVSAGGSGARCAWNDKTERCVYRKCWSQRWSYAIPLEILYTTPLSKWNPHDIAHLDAVSDTGGLTPDTPLEGSSRMRYFRTPAEFFVGGNDPQDPADTSGGDTYVRNKAGKVVQTRASGHRIVFPKIKGVGLVRQRYPIAPIHEAGSAAWKEAKALQELVVNKGNPHIAAIIAEKRLVAEGVQLQLGGGGGHSHTVSLSPVQARQLRKREVDEVIVISSTASGHAHVVEVYLNEEGAFEMHWCAQGAVSGDDECPADLAPSGCGTSAAGRPCCHQKCPDGHASLRAATP